MSQELDSTGEKVKSSSFVDSVAKSDASSLRSVLVVEDDQLVREVVEGIVESLGLLPLLAADGEAAVALFEKHQSDICCVILDYELPGMHYAVALARFRALNQNVKVILSTGYSPSEVSGYIGDVNAYVSKPYEPAVLIRQLLRLLK